MGGLGFLNGMFVAGAAVALVPIIIHLVQRRKILQVVFGSVRFLRKMSHRVVRRRRLTELLLILLRALALAGLALAFARPFIWKPSQRVGAQAAGGEQAVLVMMDNSYSMTASNNFAKARKQAQEILNGMDPVAKVGVAVFSSQFQLLCPIGSSLAEARSAVDRIQPSANATDLAMALEQADRQLLQRTEQDRHLIVLSDFPRSSWQLRSDWKMTPGIGLQVRNLADADIPNVYVERVSVPRLVVAGGFAEVISAMIANKTDKPVNNAEVVVRLGDKLAERLTVNIRPNSSTPIHFRRAFSDPGDTIGSISVTYPDSMQADNTAPFCVHVTPRVRVLVVNGDVGEKLVRNNGFFINTALAPQVEGQVSPFAITEVAPDALRADDIKNTDAVLLADVDTIGGPALAALREFVKGGGGLGLVCGSKVRPDEFNKALAEVAPCKLWKTALDKKDDPVVMSMVDFKHEIFRVFDGPHLGDLASAMYVQFFSVKDSQTATVLARFSNGQPAMLEKAIGKGKSILFTSALDLEWNNLCLKSVFVPLLHQVTRRLCTAQTAEVHNVLVGDRVACNLSADVSKVELVAPSGRKQPLEPVKIGEGDAATRSVAFTAEEQGVYQVILGKESSRYAVNLDPREPDLVRMDTRELVSAVQPKPIPNVEKAAGAPAVVAKATARERAEGQQKLWMYLIGLALLALGVEMVLAAREQAA